MENTNNVNSDSKKQIMQYNKMTTQPIASLLFSLSVPTIITMMVTNIYNIVDTAFVGTLGTSQSGATGIVFSFMAILQAIAFMCGQGAGSIMSRRLGEKKIDEATMYASTGFFLSFTLGLIIGVVTWIFAEPIVYFFGSTVTIAPYAKIYILCIALAAPFFTSSLTLNNLLRYEGLAKLGTVGMMSGAVLNMGLDAILIFGFRLGILGAGIATTVAQIFSFAILVSMFLRGRTQTRIAFRYIAREAQVSLTIMATGFPSLVRQGLNSLAALLMNRYSREYGDAAVAAMSCVSRIGFFPMAFAIGIGQGFQPISSFNYGAGRKDRVRKAFWTAIEGEEIVLFILGIPMFITAPSLIAILRDAPEVIEIGTRALRLLCVAHLFIPLTMMVEMGFQSIGKKAYATFASCLRSGVLFVPLLVVLAYYRGLKGIQEAQPLSFVCSFVVGIFLCRVYLKQMQN